MGFRFNLQTVLQQRSRAEETAQREYAEAQAAVNEVLQLIESMYRRMDEAREEIAAALKQGTAAAMDEVRTLEEFLIAQKRRIEYARLQARELMAVSEEKQEALINAAREKKVLVKLKEKRQQEYREMRAKLEAKELDDLTTIRQAWRKNK